MLPRTIMVQAHRFGDSKIDIKISEIVVTTFIFGWTDTNPKLFFFGLLSEKNLIQEVKIVRGSLDFTITIKFSTSSLVVV